MSLQLIEPRLTTKRFLPRGDIDGVARAFPRIDTVVPGQIFGVCLELMRIGCTTLPSSGLFLRAGHDLDTWSDLELASLLGGNFEKCVTHAQLIAYGRLREATYDQISDYDPGWDAASPDSTPTRSLALIAGAEMLIQDASDPYYESAEDIRDGNMLCWREPESAHERLDTAPARRASFALFSALTGFHGYDEETLAYRSPLP